MKQATRISRAGISRSMRKVGLGVRIEPEPARQPGVGRNLTPQNDPTPDLQGLVEPSPSAHP